MSNGSDLRQLQNVELGIYKEIAELCKRNNLRYYAIGGTLLGAVRHNGFIPWDDDIDIAMPRPDYDIFLSIAKEELSQSYEVVTYKDFSREKFAPFFCQIQKKNSKVSLKFSETPRVSPIWLDVFPLDAMPSDDIKRKIQTLRLLYRRMKIQFSMYEQNAHQYRSGRPLHEKILMKFREITKFGSNWDTKQMFCELEHDLRKYSFENEEYIVNLMGAYKFKEMFPKSWFEETVDLKFEDTSIPCPVEYDRVLTQMYGEYMTPPELEKQGDQHKLSVLATGDESGVGK